MPDIPSTRLSLLARLRDARDQDAWSDFVRLYAPVIYRFARRHSLQDADAADLTQDVLRSVAGGIERFDPDPERGRFRSWLLTLAHRRLYDLLQQKRRHAHESGDLAEQPDPAEEKRWQHDLEKELFHHAAAKVRPAFSATTWDAFWRTAVDGQPVPETARDLGLSVAAVYLARSRVMIRLRAEVQRMTADEDPTRT